MVILILVTIRFLGALILTLMISRWVDMLPIIMIMGMVSTTPMYSVTLAPRTSSRASQICLEGMGMAGETVIIITVKKREKIQIMELEIYIVRLVNFVHMILTITARNILVMIMGTVTVAMEITTMMNSTSVSTVTGTTMTMSTTMAMTMTMSTAMTITATITTSITIWKAFFCIFWPIHWGVSGL